jgi:hypothetical protein
MWYVALLVLYASFRRKHAFAIRDVLVVGQPKEPPSIAPLFVLASPAFSTVNSSPRFPFQRRQSTCCFSSLFKTGTSHFSAPFRARLFPGISAVFIPRLA